MGKLNVDKHKWPFGSALLASPGFVSPVVSNGWDDDREVRKRAAGSKCPKRYNAASVASSSTPTVSDFPHRTSRGLPRD